MIVKQLFSEKFRPKNLKQLIVPPRIRDELNKGLIQNLLLYGQSGNGKTSSLFILAKDHPFLYINASSERGIDVIREKISKFCSTISLEDGRETLKCVILDECLEENEKIRIGKLDNYKNIKLKDLKKNIIYQCPSFNVDNKQLENDTCEVVSIKEDDIYEVEMKDGKKIKVSANHPFMVLDKNNNIIEKSIEENLNMTDDIIVF